MCTVPEIRVNFMIIMSIMSICSYCYYAINYQMKDVKGSIIINTLASQAAEVSAVLLSGVLLAKMGPKKGFAFIFAVSASGSIALIFVVNSGKTSLIPIFVFLAKFGIAASFSMVFVAAVSLTPTIFTASIFGFSNVAARSVTVLAPEVVEIPGVVPIVINVVCACVAGLVSTFLREKIPRFV